MTTTTTFTAHNIPQQRVEDLLCNAFEDGSAYWAEADGDHTQAFEPGGVIVREFEEFLAPDLVLNVAAIQSGLAIMEEKYPIHFANFLNEDDDAETGDVFLQCCLLGEIVYG